MHVLLLLLSGFPFRVGGVSTCNKPKQGAFSYSEWRKNRLMHKDQFSHFLLIALVALLLALAGCGPQSGDGSGSQAQNAPFNLFGSNGPTTTPFLPGENTPAAAPVFEGPLSVKIYSPEDNFLTSENQVTITGTADSGTVISFNDEIAAVGRDRQFNVTMQLVEGLNVFEITASDPDGNQDSAYLTVIYEPNPSN